MSNNTIASLLKGFGGRGRTVPDQKPKEKKPIAGGGRGRGFYTTGASSSLDTTFQGESPVRSASPSGRQRTGRGGVGNVRRTATSDSSVHTLDASANASEVSLGGSKGKGTPASVALDAQGTVGSGSSGGVRGRKSERGSKSGAVAGGVGASVAATAVAPGTAPLTPDVFHLGPGSPPSHILHRLNTPTPDLDVAETLDLLSKSMMLYSSATAFQSDTHDVPFQQYYANLSPLQVFLSQAHYYVDAPERLRVAVLNLLRACVEASLTSSSITGPAEMKAGEKAAYWDETRRYMSLAESDQERQALVCVMSSMTRAGRDLSDVPGLIIILCENIEHYIPIEMRGGNPEGPVLQSPFFNPALRTPFMRSTLTDAELLQYSYYSSFSLLVSLHKFSAPQIFPRSTLTAIRAALKLMHLPQEEAIGGRNDLGILSLLTAVVRFGEVNGTGLGAARGGDTAGGDGATLQAAETSPAQNDHSMSTQATSTVATTSTSEAHARQPMPFAPSSPGSPDLSQELAPLPNIFSQGPSESFLTDDVLYDVVAAVATIIGAQGLVGTTYELGGVVTLPPLPSVHTPIADNMASLAKYKELDIRHSTLPPLAMQLMRDLLRSPANQALNSLRKMFRGPPSSETNTPCPTLLLSGTLIALYQAYDAFNSEVSDRQQDPSGDLSYARGQSHWPSMLSLGLTYIAPSIKRVLRWKDEWVDRHALKLIDRSLFFAGARRASDESSYDGTLVSYEDWMLAVDALMATKWHITEWERANEMPWIFSEAMAEFGPAMDDPDVGSKPFEPLSDVLDAFTRLLHRLIAAWLKNDSFTGPRSKMYSLLLSLSPHLPPRLSHAILSPSISLEMCLPIQSAWIDTIKRVIKAFFTESKAHTVTTLRLLSSIYDHIRLFDNHRHEFLSTLLFPFIDQWFVDGGTYPDVASFSTLSSLLLDVTHDAIENLSNASQSDEQEKTLDSFQRLRDFFGRVIKTLHERQMKLPAPATGTSGASMAMSPQASDASAVPASAVPASVALTASTPSGRMSSLTSSLRARRSVVASAASATPASSASPATFRHSSDSSVGPARAFGSGLAGELPSSRLAEAHSVRFSDEVIISSASTDAAGDEPGDDLQSSLSIAVCALISMFHMCLEQHSKKVAVHAVQLFRDLLALVGDTTQASVTRLLILQWMVRIRADAAHRVYWVRDVDISMMASTLERDGHSASVERGRGADTRGRDPRDLRSRDARDTRGRDVRDTRGRDVKDTRGRDARDSRDLRGPSSRSESAFARSASQRRFGTAAPAASATSEDRSSNTSAGGIRSKSRGRFQSILGVGASGAALPDVPRTPVSTVRLWSYPEVLPHAFEAFGPQTETRGSEGLVSFDHNRMRHWREQEEDDSDDNSSDGGDGDSDSSHARPRNRRDMHLPIEDTSDPDSWMVVLPVSEYLALLCTLLLTSTDWELVSYVLCHFSQQTSNKHLFCGPRCAMQILSLRALICAAMAIDDIPTSGTPLVMKDMRHPEFAASYLGYLVPPAPLKRSDIQKISYECLSALIAYRSLFSKAQQDEVVRTFTEGLTFETARPCLDALVMCCYELQPSVTKYLAEVMKKLQKVISSSPLAVFILEFLSSVARIPALYANFTEGAYQTVFAITGRYIALHNQQRAIEKEGRSVRDNARGEQGGADSTPSEDTDAALANAFSQYVLMLAFYSITSWFTAIRLEDRPRYLGFITQRLVQANDVHGSIDDATEVTFDMIARYAYADMSPRSKRSPFIDFLGPRAESRSVSYLVSSAVFTLTSLTPGWVELAIRRPSGTIRMVCGVENIFSASPYPEIDSIAAYLTRRSRILPPLKVVDDEILPRSTRGRANSLPFDASGAANAAARAERRELCDVAEDGVEDDIEIVTRRVLGLAASGTSRAELPFFPLVANAFPNDFGPTAKPERIPDEPKFKRTITLLDLVPVIDFHKVGVLYVGPNQSTEREILSNTSGSAAYSEFISALGTLVRLKGSRARDVYTGGLDQEMDMDGKWTYIYEDRILQIVFHIATLMPTNAETDPNCTLKKRHIGNDLIKIVFNDSGSSDFRFDTLPGDFNFVNIVIEPHAPLGQAWTDPKQGRMNNTEFYKVYMQFRPGMPEQIGPCGGTFRLVNKSALPHFVRQLCLSSSMFSLIYLDTVGFTSEKSVSGDTTRIEYVSNWRKRLNLIRELRTRVAEAKGIPPPEPSNGMGYTKEYNARQFGAWL